MIALFAAVHAEEEAAPAEAAPVGAVLYHHYPGFYHHAPVYAHHVAPAVYTHHVAAPVVYTAANVCKNEGGQLVPCAHGVAPGSAIYAHVGAPAAVVPAAAAPAEDGEAVVSVEKRDAEAKADPADWYYGYYGHPYGYAGYYGSYGHPGNWLSGYAGYGYYAGK